MGLDLTGIIAGALGGGANAAQGMAQQQIELANRKDFADHQTEAELLKHQRILDMNIASANAERVARNSRIDTAQQGIVDSAMNKRYAGSDADVAAAAGGVAPELAAGTSNATMDADATDPGAQAQLTPEQARVIAEAKASDRANLNSNPAVRLQALRGEMSPDHEAATNATLQRAELQNDRAKYGADTRLAGVKYNADARSDDVDERVASADRRNKETVQGRLDAAAKRMSPADQTQLKVLTQQRLGAKDQLNRVSLAIDKLRDNFSMKKEDRERAIAALDPERLAATKQLDDISHKLGDLYAKATPASAAPASDAPSSDAAPASGTFTPRPAAPAAGGRVSPAAAAAAAFPDGI